MNEVEIFQSSQKIINFSDLKAKQKINLQEFLIDESIVFFQDYDDNLHEVYEAHIKVDTEKQKQREKLDYSNQIQLFIEELMKNIQWIVKNRRKCLPIFEFQELMLQLYNIDMQGHIEKNMEKKQKIFMKKHLQNLHSIYLEQHNQYNDGKSPSKQNKHSKSQSKSPQKYHQYTIGNVSYRPLKTDQKNENINTSRNSKAKEMVESNSDPQNQSSQRKKRSNTSSQYSLSQKQISPLIKQLRNQENMKSAQKIYQQKIPSSVQQQNSNIINKENQRIDLSKIEVYPKEYFKNFTEPTKFNPVSSQKQDDIQISEFTPNYKENIILNNWIESSNNCEEKERKQSEKNNQDYNQFRLSQQLLGVVDNKGRSSSSFSQRQNYGQSQQQLQLSKDTSGSSPHKKLSLKLNNISGISQQQNRQRNNSALNRQQNKSVVISNSINVTNFLDSIMEENQQQNNEKYPYSNSNINNNNFVDKNKSRKKSSNSNGSSLLSLLQKQQKLQGNGNNPQFKENYIKYRQTMADLPSKAIVQQQNLEKRYTVDGIKLNKVLMNQDSTGSNFFQNTINNNNQAQIQQQREEMEQYLKFSEEQNQIFLQLESKQGSQQHISSSQDIQHNFTLQQKSFRTKNIQNNVESDNNSSKFEQSHLSIFTPEQLGKRQTAIFPNNISQAISSRHNLDGNLNISNEKEKRKKQLIKRKQTFGPKEFSNNKNKAYNEISSINQTVSDDESDYSVNSFKIPIKKKIQQQQQQKNRSSSKNNTLNMINLLQSQTINNSAIDNKNRSSSQIKQQSSGTIQVKVQNIGNYVNKTLSNFSDSKMNFSAKNQRKSKKSSESQDFQGKSYQKIEKIVNELEQGQNYNKNTSNCRQKQQQKVGKINGRSNTMMGTGNMIEHFQNISKQAIMNNDPLIQDIKSNGKTKRVLN